MPAPFKRLSVPEFALLLERFPFSRHVTSVHMHHTWRPNHAQFRGHESIVAMWRYHTQERRFSDIAQHLTIDPEGYVWTGRSWNQAPASASGFNGNAARGPFMFEIVGDFDRGRDRLDGAQRRTVLDVIRLVQMRFGLEPEALMFHNQMAPKSCPGTSIDRAEFLRAVREHQPTTSGGAPREARLFGNAGLASSDTVAHAISLLTAEECSRDEARADAELDYADEYGRSLTTEEAARAPEDELGPEAIELLRPHVINLRMGAFSSDGKMSTTEADVDRLFEEHLPRWVEARKAEQAPARLLLFAHGGLVKESSGLTGALRTREWWLRNGVYPIYFVWETGLFETLGDLLRKIRTRVIPEGARDIFDWTTDPVVEEAARALQAQRIWGAMKASAALASGPHGGARRVAQGLQAFLERHRDGDQGARIELHAVGHSAGSIFHGWFLPTCQASGINFDSLQLLAPAITCADFKRYLEAISTDGRKPPITTMYTMSRSFERADHCANIYRKSLLYLVSEACEHERGTPILGLEDFVRKDAQLRSFFGLREPSPLASVVWSKSPTDSGRSAARSTSHGGFDDDAPTMGSVLRRINDLSDSDAIEPFPTPPGGRNALSDWSAQVDWPDALEHQWTAISATAASVTPASSATTGATGTTGMSATSGRRIAVCFGINDYPTAPLHACVEDATLWQKTLRAYGFAAELIPQHESNRERMLDELRRLIGDSRAGDSLVFQYSGHGTQIDDLNGDENAGDTPGLDEAICPIDFADGRLLIDDDIAEQVARLPAGVRLTFLLDCCHSGSGTRFAARSLSRLAPSGNGARARFVVPTLELREKHRRFRLDGNGLQARDPLARAAATQAMREVTFSACRSKEVAWEVDGHGEFTRRAHQALAAGSDGLTNAGFLEAVLKAFGSNARQQPELDCDVSLRSARWLAL